MIHYEKGLFTLRTKHTTYQMKADAHGVLLHTYYGPRVEDCDLSYRIRYVDRGFSPVPEEAGEDRAFSLDVLPQEYSAAGMGDFRLPALDLELPNGSRSEDLRFKSFRVEPGKYALEGLPAFRGEEDETLVVMKGLNPDFYYQVNGQGRYPGSALMEAGWPLPLPWGDYQSWQFYLTAL